MTWSGWDLRRLRGGSRYVDAQRLASIPISSNMSPYEDVHLQIILIAVRKPQLPVAAQLVALI